MTTRQLVSSGSPYEPVIGFSRAVRIGNVIAVSGTAPIGGDGKTVATVAGAAAGGYAGSKIQKNMQENNTTQTVEQRCRTVYDSAERPDGYQVRYRLAGQEGTVRTDRAPGGSIPVENGQLVLAGLNDPK